MTTVICLANRFSHLALGGKIPHLILHGKESYYGLLRTIGVQAFVHIEQHGPTVQGKALEESLVDSWTSFVADPNTKNSKTRYINSDTTGTIVLQTRNKKVIGGMKLIPRTWQVLEELNSILQRIRRPPGG